MLSKLPLKFYSADGCGCAPSTFPAPANQACAANTPICDPRFYTLPSIPAGKIPAIAPGSGCLGVLTDAVAGLVVSLGPGMGMAITPTPSFPLTEHNPAVSGVVSPGGTFPFVMIATGGDPVTPWKRLLGPSSGTYQILSVDGSFRLVDASSVGQLNTLFLAASSALAIEPLGFVQTGTTGGGDPIFAPRKLTGSVNDRPVPVVLKYNGTNGRYEESAHALAAILPIDKLGFRTLEETDSAGVAVAGGITLLGTSVDRGDLKLMIYDEVAKRLYKMPETVCQSVVEVSDVALVENNSWVNPTPHGVLNIADNNWPKLYVSALLRFDDLIRLDGVRLKINGIVVHTFYDRLDEAGGGQSEFHFSVALTGVVYGALALTIEYKESGAVSSTATKVVASSLTAHTIL